MLFFHTVKHPCRTVSATKCATSGLERRVPELMQEGVMIRLHILHIERITA